MICRVPVNDSVTVTRQEDCIPLQSGGCHDGNTLRGVEDRDKRLVIRDELEVLSVKVDVEAFDSPDDGESFLVDLGVPLLCLGQGTRFECDWSFLATCEDV